MRFSSGATEASLLGILFLAASIIRGGNRQIAIALLLLISLILLSVMLADLVARRYLAVNGSAQMQDKSSRVNVWQSILLSLVLLAPLYIGAFQLAPIFPQDLSPLSPDAIGPSLHKALPSWSLHDRIGLSTVPDATVTSALCGVILSIALWATIRLREEFLPPIVLIWILIAATQIVMVTLQIAGGTGSWAYFASDFQQYKFIGTFNSRNTLGGFFAICMPMVVWYCFFQRRGSDSIGSSRRASVTLGLVVLAGMTMLILGMQSRGGLLAFMTSAIMMVAVVWGARPREGRSSRALLGLLLAMVLAFFATAMFLVGWETVSERFRVDDVARPVLFSTAWNGAKQMFPFGSGLGTFGSVYPLFQPLELPGYFSLTHNDYIQFVFELGLVGVIPAVSALLLIIAALWKISRNSKSPFNFDQYRIARYCALASMSALLLHSTVEFNMHIPSLTLLGVFLIGVLIKILFARE